MSRITFSPRPLALLVSAVFFCPSVVWSQVDTSRCVSFGDSLTDNDSLYLLFGTDPWIYGPDPFEAVFQQAADHDDQLENHAVLRSTSSDVLDQVRSYVDARDAGEIDSASLISLQAGGNDFLTTEVLLTLASAPPGESELADSVASEIRGNLLAGLRLLKSSDRNAALVLWTIPDVTLSPYVIGLGLDAASQVNIRAHLERTNRLIRTLERQPRIAVLDIFTILVEVSIAPPTIGHIALTPPPYFGFGSAIFADPIHPTAVSNGLLANELISKLNARFGDSIPTYSDSELLKLIQGVL